MAATTVTKRVTNGVSLAISHTITDADVVNQEIDITITGVDFDLVPIVSIVDAAGAYVALTGMTITNPSDGVVHLASAGWVAGQVINIIIQRAS